MKISIIILTYNSSSLIYDCLNSIFRNNDIGDSLDVIVIDNASEDQSVTFSLIEKEFSEKNVFMYDTGNNGGYGKGNNFGISKTSSDIIIVMNPDVRVVKPILSRIIKEFSNSSLGMAGVSFVDGSLPYYFKPEHSSLFRSLFIKWYVKRKKYDPKKMYLSGSFLIFDRNSFYEAGSFDENIFMYYEEPDITNRILNTGKEVKWLKDVGLLHLAHGRSYNRKLHEIMLQSLEYYCNKYNLLLMNVYRHTLLVLRIKLFISWLVRDKFRKVYFERQIDTIVERMKLI